MNVEKPRTWVLLYHSDGWPRMLFINSHLPNPLCTPRILVMNCCSIEALCVDGLIQNLTIPCIPWNKNSFSNERMEISNKNCQRPCCDNTGNKPPMSCTSNEFMKPLVQENPQISGRTMKYILSMEETPALVTSYRQFIQLFSITGIYIPDSDHREPPTGITNLNIVPFLVTTLRKFPASSRFSNSHKGSVSKSWQSNLDMFKTILKSYKHATSRYESEQHQTEMHHTSKKHEKTANNILHFLKKSKHKNEETG